jgi:hypothetical protein
LSKIFMTPLACLLALACTWASRAALAGATAQAQAQATLTMAEQPLRLIRGASIFKAGNGVAVQKDDILETGAAGVHVEAGPGAILALGPRTRVLVRELPPAGKSAEVALLQGWVKLAASPGTRALVATPVLQVTLAGGATIVHAGDSLDAAFAEEGAQQAALVDARGRTGAPLKLGAEQYTQADPAHPQLAAGRPARAFVAAMPPSFRDRLARAPAVPNAGKVAPLKEGEAGFADVEPWLTAPLPGARAYTARFRPRLADPGFRQQLERALGQDPAWRAVLHPPRPATP